MSYLLFLRTIMTKNYLLMEGLCLVIHFVKDSHLCQLERTPISLILLMMCSKMSLNVTLGRFSLACFFGHLFQTPCVPGY